MRAEHVAIDGSRVSLEADADLSARATATGWAIVPSLMQAHPFTVHPPQHSELVEKVVRSELPAVEVTSREDLSLRDGTLRVALVRLPTATGSRRTLTVGAWEGETGALATSLVGEAFERLVEVFDTLQFSESRAGLAVDSPVVARPRAPEVVQEVPGVGVLAVRPAIATELERIPRSRGFRAAHGELFRVREGRRALTFVGDTTVVSVQPFEETGPDELLDVAQGLRVEWTPRSGR